MCFVNQLIYFHERNVRAGKKKNVTFYCTAGELTLVEQWNTLSQQYL